MHSPDVKNAVLHGGVKEAVYTVSATWICIIQSLPLEFALENWHREVYDFKIQTTPKSLLIDVYNSSKEEVWTSQVVLIMLFSSNEGTNCSTWLYTC